MQLPRLRWTVRRRYSEFHTLHTTLVAQYSSIVSCIPFPDKTIFKMSELVIEDRRKALQAYLRELSSISVPNTAGGGMSRIRELDVFLELPEHVCGRAPVASARSPVASSPPSLGKAATPLMVRVTACVCRVCAHVRVCAWCACACVCMCVVQCGVAWRRVAVLSCGVVCARCVWYACVYLCAWVRMCTVLVLAGRSPCRCHALTAVACTVVLQSTPAGVRPSSLFPRTGELPLHTSEIFDYIVGLTQCMASPRASSLAVPNVTKEAKSVALFLDQCKGATRWHRYRQWQRRWRGAALLFRCADAAGRALSLQPQYSSRPRRG